MTAPEPNHIVWRTSSYSGTGADYVQVASTPERILVRDSKDPDGPHSGRPHPGLAHVPCRRNALAPLRSRA